MKSRKHKKHGKKSKAKPRNNRVGGGIATTRPHPRPRLRVPRRGEAPPWKTIGAAVAGSIGSAIASGLVVNQKIAEPETISLLMAATGGLGAYLTDGNARVAFTGVAAAGAGQYALVKLGRIAEKKAQKTEDEKAKAEAQAQPQTQLPSGVPPAAPAPRGYAGGRGVVVDLFRDSAADLDRLDEDELRYSTRDADPGDDEDDTPLEIDLDEAA